MAPRWGSILTIFIAIMMQASAFENEDEYDDYCFLEGRDRRLCTNEEERYFEAFLRKHKKFARCDALQDEKGLTFSDQQMDRMSWKEMMSPMCDLRICIEVIDDILRQFQAPDCTLFLSPNTTMSTHNPHPYNPKAMFCRIHELCNPNVYS